MSRQADCAKQEYESDNWRCVCASDSILRESESKWARGAEKDTICYLSKGFRNGSLRVVVYIRKYQCRNYTQQPARGSVDRE